MRENPHEGGKLEARIPVSSMCRFWLTGLLSGQKRREEKERMGWEEREEGRSRMDREGR